MSAKANKCGNKGKAKPVTGFSKARKVTDQRSRWRQADREKRQELARLRHEASLSQPGQPKDRHKGPDRERLKGKKLFYCESPAARAKEIQRRLSEQKRQAKRGEQLERKVGQLLIEKEFLEKKCEQLGIDLSERP